MTNLENEEHNISQTKNKNSTFRLLRNLLAVEKQTGRRSFSALQIEPFGSNCNLCLFHYKMMKLYLVENLFEKNFCCTVSIYFSPS
jgi:hypothetical protein